MLYPSPASRRSEPRDAFTSSRTHLRTKDDRDTIHVQSVIREQRELPQEREEVNQQAKMQRREQFQQDLRSSDPGRQRQDQRAGFGIRAEREESGEIPTR